VAFILAFGCVARAQIKVETTLVTVKVVVRDAKGRPVSGLHKEDFHLLDNGKLREITGFSVEAATAAISQVPASQPPANPAAAMAPSSAAPIPQRFAALFFDDLHMEFGEVGQTRDAVWRYISTTLQPEDRVAIFTSSNQDRLDFTADRDKLHQVLFQLAPHSRTNPLENQCPAIGEYQAFLIAERQQSDAFEIAEREGWKCDCGDTAPTVQYSIGMQRGDCQHAVFIKVQGLADQIWGLADRQSQDALDVMEGVVNLLAARPGKRTLVLVSPGFLSAARERSINILIDRALRRNIVVNALDAAGLYTKPLHQPILVERPELQARKSRMENEALIVQRDVLAALSEGTGGAFFHNSNDFDDGFRQTVEAPEIYYVLSFSPQDVKLDGKFHALKVTLNAGHGWDVQARRGYFANATLAENNSAKDELQNALYAQDERRDLPAAITARVEKQDGEMLAVTVKIHVDIRAVQFRKEGDRSVDTLTFDTAVFDRDGKYVTGKESSLDFRLPDAKLEELLKSGINAQTSFRVVAGAYRIREVVRDTESKKLSALNCNVEAAAR
jgi:VWFA-related protein